MEIIVVGLKLGEGPPAFLEAFEALHGERFLDETQARLHSMREVREVVPLITCHRVEFYVGLSRPPAPGASGGVAGLPGPDLPVFPPLSAISGLIYRLTGDSAIRHLIRVASGLDSLLKGEAQVLGQVRSAFADAVERRTVGPILSPVFHRAFRAARRIRAHSRLEEVVPSWADLLSETITSRSGVSSATPVLVLGSGRMARALRESLRARGAIPQPVETDHADSLASMLPQGGVLVTASGRGRVVPAAQFRLEAAAATAEIQVPPPIDIWDLGVPRNVDPTVEQIPRVRLWTLAGLTATVKEAALADSSLAEAISLAEAMVESELADYRCWRREREIGPSLLRLGRLLELFELPAGDQAGSHGLRRRLLAGFASLASEARDEQEAGARLALFEEVLRRSIAAAPRTSKRGASRGASGPPLAGVVSLVGAGPGDAGFLTLRAAQRLREADVVYHDALVSLDVLALCRKDARLVPVGKRRASVLRPQRDIEAALIRDARRGLAVVRLKGGDPFVFGRGGEEALALLRSGISFEIIPGVSSGIAVPALAGIPLTHRGLSSSAAFVTAHDLGSTNGSERVRERLQHLARGADTLVVFMAGGELARVREALLCAGLPADTPAALVESGTLPEEVFARGTLGELHLLSEARGGGPLLVVVGRTVALSDELRPAAGRKQANEINRQDNETPSIEPTNQRERRLG